MTPASDPTPTETFGPYVVYERLGMGGMATVARAKKQGIAGYERGVALKRMLPHLAEDTGFVQSFVREAKVASLLLHPNVAQVYDFGRIDGIYYIAMELVAGLDMRKVLRHANRTRESVPLPVILAILIELCDALDYAHTFHDEQGQPLNILHRDISPSNLILAHTGHLKVIDFGIAKASSHFHTDSGQVKGKLGYMSPEAALGMQIGPASDVFSAAVVAWELITASPLFSAKSDFETMRRVREAPIGPPSRINPACPPELDAVIMAALERDVARRLPSAEAFRSGLANIAARGGLQLSARTVAEWMARIPLPANDRTRRASWAPPAAQRASLPLSLPLPAPMAGESLTMNLRAPPVGLVRSDEDAQLATEIWGDDARTSMSPGPDFSSSTPPPVQALEVPFGQLPQARVVPIAAPPAPTPAQLPPQPMMTPSQAWLPPPVMAPPAPSSRRGLVVVLGLLLLGVVGAIIFVATTRGGTPAGAPPTTAAGPAPDAALVAVVVPVDAAVAVTPPDAATVIAAIAPPVDPQGGHHDPKHPPVTHKHDPTPVHVVTTTHEPDPPIADPKPDPVPVPVPVVPTPPVTPPPVTPPPPHTPARTPVVSAASVTKLSGELPQLKVHGSDTSGDVLAKICIDEQGHVSSVKIVRSPPEIADDLQRALTGWRYKPFVKDGAASAVCFPLSLHVVVKHAD